MSIVYDVDRLKLSGFEIQEEENGMSEMEHRKGELLLIQFERGMSFSDKLKQLEEVYDLEDFNPVGVWSSNDIVWFKGNFYSIEEKRIDANEDIMTAKVVNNEVIEFETRFYNGGACFAECIEVALNKLN